MDMVKYLVSISEHVLSRHTPVYYVACGLSHTTSVYEPEKHCSDFTYINVVM